jgi:phage replication initiation protein
MTRTHVDWLAYRSQGEVMGALDGLKAIYGSIGHAVSLKHRSRGWQGYEQSADILLQDMVVGLMAYGGEKQRGWIYTSITGTGCSWITDWDGAQEALEHLPAMDLRRVDIALDTARREVTHDSVVEAYRAGQFTTSGRPPKCQRIESERPEDGRTVYVGSRDNDKFFRGYEKGLQLTAGTDQEYVQITTDQGIEKVPAQDMYRCELELKAKSGALPFDVIDHRDHYFAGSYPYLQHVLHEVEPEALLIDRRVAARADLDRRLQAIRSMYGTTLFTALTVHGGDIGAVWERIVGRKHNADLVRAGALFLEE